MGRQLVIGDIHGSYNGLVQLLERAMLQKGDTLIFLGDYVDGWKQSAMVVEHLMYLSGKYNCIFMRGNHDDLLMHWLKTGKFNEQWFNHGGRSTIDNYNAMDQETKQVHVEFLEKLQDYYLDNDNRLFVHAGFTSLNGVSHEHFNRMFFWDRTLWESALALDKKMPLNHVYYPKRLTLYKEIFIGHTPVTRIDKTVPVQMANVWNVDTGAAFKGPVTIMDVDTKEFWQSDPLHTLHPDENGRN